MNLSENLSKIPVLVADDMSLGRLSSKNLLQKCGYSNITLASTGVEAWNLLIEAEARGEPFHLILSDWVMPDMNGLELVQKIKSQPWKVFPKIILVTAETDMNLVKSAIQEGASGYIRKPLTLDSLKLALEKISMSR
jgi:CheY-like chemotaxis protein